MAYDESNIRTLSSIEHIRQRPGMYIGRLGNGSHPEDGIYILLKEVIDNSIDEFMEGNGSKIVVTLDGQKCSVRDYGRGCPFLVKEDGTNLLIDIYTKAHVGGKFSEDSYKNVAGLNGVGGSCVCLSSEKFLVKSFRNGVKAEAYFEKGINISYKEEKTKEKNGTYVWFIPDKEVFKNGEIGFSFDRICK